MFLAALLVSAPSCLGKDPYNPGEPVGAFHVTAKLVSNSCGQASNPWEFDIRLRHEATTLYWVQGSLPVSGTVDASAHAVLRSTGQDVVRAADSHAAGCTVTREDTLDVVLSDATSGLAVDPATTSSFAGTLAYHFGTTSDSDCSDQTTASGASIRRCRATSVTR
ncbi:hypothetical protein AKJ09_09000 [Labilithrix luteola]|uniref:Uncharacterized protein n=2 Tax=Labilithrix luteola TaxID=1391654 RepID=A0A0K1Q9K0_9BACT|nr:hypothetical protein AKJ09_09000 [Labilithrix luteola]